MKWSKGKLAIIVVCLVCLSFAGNLFYKEFIRTQNIFDKMFYTRIRTHYDWWGEPLGGFSNDHKIECLREGERKNIFCSRNNLEKSVVITVRKQVDEFETTYQSVIKKRLRMP